MASLPILSLSDWLSTDVNDDDLGYRILDDGEISSLLQNQSGDEERDDSSSYESTPKV